ncbi:hypothetical protein [Nocardia sp. GAS34]|uniref:hypothetical protein n=1 Tax=unclassified Nocardia TaxID=2637762 RepID=UPI003D1EECC5
MAHPSPDHRPSSNRRAMSSRRQPVRTMIVTLASGVMLACCAATAAAGPEDYPLGAHSGTPEQAQPERDEKAQGMGGDLATRIINRGADLGSEVMTKTIETGADLAKCVVALLVSSETCG